jgi:hypothetical protein
MISIDTLLLTGFTLICMIVSYYVGRKHGFTQGIDDMAHTLIHLEIITKDDLQKLVDIQDEFDDE